MTQVVAVDGRYELFPADTAISPIDQHAAIVACCRELGVGLTLHVPDRVWPGEVEKRTFHFALAYAVSEPGDWFWIMDADEVISRAPADLKDRLSATALDCADMEAVDVMAQKINDPRVPVTFNVRHLFRAQPIRVSTNHITYVTPDGRLLWGYEGGDQPFEEALDLSPVLQLEHRPGSRTQERNLAKYQYYALRNEAKIERGDCAVCGAPADELVPTRWRMTDTGPVGDWMEACDSCASKAEVINRLTLEQIGVDPDRVIGVENRMGCAPAQRA